MFLFLWKSFSPSTKYLINPKGENLSHEEYLIAGFFKFIHFLQDWRLNPLGKLPTFEKDKNLAPGTFISVFVLSDSLEDYLEKKHYNMPILERAQSQIPPRIAQLTKESSLDEISIALFDPKSGPQIRDAKWHYRSYKGIVLGSDLVDWIMINFQDIHTREEAVAFGTFLMQKGLLEHYSKKHSFLDGFYYYKLIPFCESYSTETIRKISYATASETSFSDEPIALSKTFLINTDNMKGKKSRIQWALMHYDSVYNSNATFSFHLHWLTCNPNLLEEMLRCWARKAFQFGYHFYETPVLPYDPNSSLDLFTFVLEIQLAAMPPVREDGNSKIHLLYFDLLMRKFHFHLHFEPDAQLLEKGIAA